MQRRILFISIVILMISNTLQLKAQESESPKGINTFNKKTTYNKWFVGSSFLMLGNFIPEDPNPLKYFQLNFGYRITLRDVVQFRFKKSQYAWPLGIPFGPDFDMPGLNYLGYERKLAPQIGYKRFWRKGDYSSVYILNAFEKYVDENKKKIGNRFNLYTDFYLGFHSKLFKDMFFFEPAIDISYWPIRTGIPKFFNGVESQWSNYSIQSTKDLGFKFLCS
ncbi:hypothetical protein [Algoriphagus confluentis]|uniref:DUF3575 domain-containing protein n=1 Tax=Algoriphagus confluentis TaxID=1697556 RepID=A0ABQ6PRR8_9BACT|nr:hypothetical protein Aconfl_33370 [Algoriphagus confluentis]